MQDFNQPIEQQVAILKKDVQALTQKFEELTALLTKVGELLTKGLKEI